MDGSREELHTGGKVFMVLIYARSFLNYGRVLA